MNTVPQPSIFVYGPKLEGLTAVLDAADCAQAATLSEADGVIVTYGADPANLAEQLRQSPRARWVQLPTAGIELFSESLQARPEIAWTSAKGAYAEPVAEHALLLVLALLRNLPERITARTWGQASGTSLHGLNAVVVGAGGVALETVRLLKAFDTNVTVVRRRPDPVAAADETIALDRLHEILPDTDVLVLASALTDATRDMISTYELELLKRSAIVVNIGRGGLIDTDALVRALDADEIRGAALDVTAPEPLPEGHPLWEQPKCIITPHTADTLEMIIPLYLNRIRANLTAFAAGAEFDGLVDAAAGY